MLRPVIPIGLHYSEGIFEYAALLDSGADHNIFHAEVGEVMGLDVEAGKLLEFWDVTGNKEKAYFHQIEILIAGTKQKICCGFVKNWRNPPYGILGQDDFFKIYTILFDLSKEFIELRNRNSS